MNKIQVFFSKVIPYAGMFGAILAVMAVFMNDSFRSEGLSVFLVCITVLVIYAIYNIIFNKNKKIKDSPGIDSGGFMFGLVFASLCAVVIRMLALMLLNVDIMGKYALITYIFTIVFFMLIYVTGRVMGNHKSGLISAWIYVFLCAFDVYLVVENMQSGEKRADLMFNYAGSVLILLTYLFSLVAVKSKTKVTANVMAAMSGLVCGLALYEQKNAVVIASCIIVMFAVTKTTYKYINREKIRSDKYKPYKYILFFALGFIVTAASVIAYFMASGQSEKIPGWILYIKEFNGINDIFCNIDEVAIRLMGGVYFARNHFISYTSILLYVFCLVMSAVGCLAVAKNRKTTAIPAILFVISIVCLGIIESESVSYICPAIPFMVMMAGYGVSDSINIAYVRNYDVCSNELCAPGDVIKDESMELEVKYELPEGSCDTHIKPTADESFDSFEDDESVENLSDVGSDNDSTVAGNVVSGEVLTDMLDNLYGVNNNEEIVTDVVAEKQEDPNDSVIIFKDVIK